MLKLVDTHARGSMAGSLHHRNLRFASLARLPRYHKNGRTARLLLDRIVEGGMMEV